jgi:anti-anti-sigma factor
MSDTANASGVVVRPGQDIVASSVEDLRAEWKKLLQSGVAALTVDLAGVEMIDSVGLGLLIATHNTLGKSGGRLRVCGASPDIQSLFRTMRLDKHFILEG